MSTLASPLSVAGSRTSGTPVRTQNGKKIHLLLLNFYIYKEHDSNITKTDMRFFIIGQ